MYTPVAAISGDIWHIHLREGIARLNWDLDNIRLGKYVWETV